MSVNGYWELSLHVGHRIECVFYAGVQNVAVECLDCGLVLIDYDRPEEEGE